MNMLKTKVLDLKGIAWFLAIAFGLAWLIDLPMYLDGRGLNSPWAALIVLQNFTPAVATFIVVRWISPLPQIRTATGLRRGVKGTGWGWYDLWHDSRLDAPGDRQHLACRARSCRIRCERRLSLCL